MTPTKIPLSWTAPTSTGGADIVSYTLERAPDMSGNPGTWDPVWIANMTSYTDEDLDPETTYHYRVSATNSAGTSLPSDTVSRTTPAAPVVTIAPHSATVTEGAVARFSVKRSGSLQDAITVHVAVSGTSDMGITTGNATVNMSAGTSAVFYTVPTSGDAVDEEDGLATATLRTADDGATIVGYTIGTPASATVTIQDDDTVPGAPIVSALGLHTKLVLNWPMPAEGTSSITGYDYRYKTTAGAEATWSTWTDTGLSGSDATNDFEITGLTNGTDYIVEVRAKSLAGVSLAGSTNATPTPAPVVTSIAITSDPGTDKTYAIGDTIEFTLTFDKDLSLGGTDTSKPAGYLIYQTDYATDTASQDSPEASCAIGTNTKTLVCTGLVEEGWYDTDGIFVFANALADQGQISHFAGPLGQRANIAHTALPVDANHKIDGVRPFLVTLGANAAKTSTDGTKVILKFSEKLSAADRTKMTIEATESGSTTTLATSAATVVAGDESRVELTLTNALTSNTPTLTVALAADAVSDLVGNGNSVLTATSLTNNYAAAEWELTLTDSSGNAVTELIEDGDSATATVSITNGVTFSTNQTVQLKWGSVNLEDYTYIPRAPATSGQSPSLPANQAEASKSAQWRAQPSPRTTRR